MSQKRHIPRTIATVNDQIGARVRERLQMRYEGRLGIFSVIVGVSLAGLAYLGLMQIVHEPIGRLLSAMPFAALVGYYVRERRAGVTFTTEGVCRTIFGAFLAVWLLQHHAQVGAAYHVMRGWKPAWVLMTVGMSGAFITLLWCLGQAFGPGYIVVRQTPIVMLHRGNE